jgi:hypothetical protein
MTNLRSNDGEVGLPPGFRRHGRPKEAHGPEDPKVNGSRRHADRLGGFGVRQALALGEQQRGPMRRRKRGNGPFKVEVPILCRRRNFRPELQANLVRHSFALLHSPPVKQNAAEPGMSRRVPAEPVPSIVSNCEDIRRQVLRVLPIGDESQRKLKTLPP